jgi:nucleosome binding factor SPN SPT16 subunit
VSGSLCYTHKERLLTSRVRTDILFSNIKHLFFQPCDYELVVLIHVTLKSPIMLGKKKVKVRGYRGRRRDQVLMV